MNRAELEHGIRATTEIIQADEVIIIGSQSVLLHEPPRQREEPPDLHEIEGFYWCPRGDLNPHALYGH